MGLDLSASTGHYAELAAGLDNVNTLSVIGWARLGAGAGYKGVLFAKGSSNVKFAEVLAGDALKFTVKRATTNADATASTTLTVGEIFAYCVTFDSTDGPRIFLRSLSSSFAEVSYTSRNVGAGALSSDSATPWTIGNGVGHGGGWTDTLYTLQLIARRLSNTTEMDALAVAMLAEVDTQFALQLGLGAANGADLSAGGRAVTVVGASATDHLPLPVPLLSGGIGMTVSLVTPVSASLSCATESLASVELAQPLPTEALASVEGAGNGNWESVQSIEQLLTSPTEQLQGVEQSSSASWESLASVEAAAALPSESLGSVEALITAAMESLQSIEAAVLAPWESEGSGTAVEALFSCSYESLALVEQLEALPLEALASVEATGILNWESLQSVEQLAGAGWESLATVEAAILAAWEAEGYVPGAAVVAKLRATLAVYSHVRGTLDARSTVRGTLDARPTVRGDLALSGDS